ncbi:MAG: EamA family transporter [Rhodospirillaceae bacterium]|jgi:drug/metabolite transporter (DMT)-like permease|nr:EamA family transporter [Rhodospirillaceae bacterium]MBT5049459.1 EamA family transporter [Rhodospirillaceae bacterium]MBT5459288.1 EamA family transporter [Rhodospirillaceae bacterium]
MNKITAVIASPYALCSYAILCWAGNFVVARLANLDVPPVSLSFWRHLLAAAMVLPLVIPVLRTDWPIIRRHAGTFAILSFLFVAGNTLVYFCVLYTTVINAALINAGVPVIAVFFSWLILRDMINRWQGLGIVLSVLGIAIVVSRGDVAALRALDFHLGDLFMLLAIICWALYMVLFKRAGLKISPWTLLLILCLGGTVWLIPAYAIEIASGAETRFSFLTISSLVYVALFSTIIAWACWNSGTLRIGPNRAASFMSLHPVFGSALAILILGEMLEGFHVVGTIPVLIGVYLVSRTYPPSRIS